MAQLTGVGSRRPGRDLVGVLAVALAVRLLVVAVTDGQPALYDAADYLRHVRAIAATGAYPDTIIAAPGTATAVRPPALPYLMGRGRFGSPAAPGSCPRLLEALLGTLTVALIFTVGRELFDRRVALVAAGLAAVFAPLALLNAALLSEPLFLHPSCWARC